MVLRIVNHGLPSLCSLGTRVNSVNRARASVCFPQFSSQPCDGFEGLLFRDDPTDGLEMHAKHPFLCWRRHSSISLSPVLSLSLSSSSLFPPSSVILEFFLQLNSGKIFPKRHFHMEISPLKYFSGDISAEISIEKSDWVSSDVFQLSRETIAKTRES